MHSKIRYFPLFLFETIFNSFDGYFFRKIDHTKGIVFEKKNYFTVKID